MSFVPLATAAPPDPVVADQPLLRQFWRPRYWSTWLLIATLWLTSMLPWRVSIKLYKSVGLLFWRLLRKRRRLVERNIAQCLPELDQTEICRLARLHFQSLAACLAETAYAWFGRVNSSLTQFHIEGDEHIYSALNADHGIILYTGHFTALEICAPSLKEIFPSVAFMFRPRHSPLLNEIQRRGRLNSGHISFGNNDVRGMLRALRQNAIVWYAPDQVHSRRANQMAQTGDATAMANAATCRIARISGAAVVPFSYRRLPDDSGYALRFYPALDNFPDEDDTASVKKLGETLQQLIAQCPDQYGWTYKRLRSAKPTMTESAQP